MQILQWGSGLDKPPFSPKVFDAYFARLLPLFLSFQYLNLCIANSDLVIYQIVILNSVRDCLWRGKKTTAIESHKKRHKKKGSTAFLNQKLRLVLSGITVKLATDKLAHA